MSAHILVSDGTNSSHSARGHLDSAEDTVMGDAPSRTVSFGEKSRKQTPSFLLGRDAEEQGRAETKTNAVLS